MTSIIAEPVRDLSSSLRNQQRASLYFYQQTQQLNNTINCYEKLINELKLKSEGHLINIEI